MHVEHVAIWTRDLERLKGFYQTYFQACVSAKYVNATTQFESYFLTFSSGTRLELMQRPSVADLPDTGVGRFRGYDHLAFSVGSEERVDALTARLKDAGYPIDDGPRRTGDGYYESRVRDCDGNTIEITV